VRAQSLASRAAGGIVVSQADAPPVGRGSAKEGRRGAARVHRWRANATDETHPQPPD